MQNNIYNLITGLCVDACLKEKSHILDNKYLLGQITKALLNYSPCAEQLQKTTHILLRSWNSTLLLSSAKGSYPGDYVFQSCMLCSLLWRVHTERNRDRDRCRGRDQDQWVSLYYVYCSHHVETGTGTWPIVSYCAGLVPCTCPGPGPVQCE